MLDVGAVDVAVTSPPYNIAGGTHGASGRYKNEPLNISGDWYRDQMDEPEYQGWLNGIVAELRRVCAGLVWVNHKTRFVDKEAIHPIRFINQPLYSEIVWARAGATAFNCRKFAPSHEFVLGFGQPHYWDNKFNTLLTVWNITQDHTAHPCSYPIEIPTRCIGASCPEDGTAIDPFAGSCTTAVAAKQLGRRCICIELEQKYCEIGAQRCRQGVLW